MGVVHELSLKRKQDLFDSSTGRTENQTPEGEGIWDCNSIRVCPIYRIFSLPGGGDQKAII